MLNMLGHITGMAAIVVDVVAIVSVVPMTLASASSRRRRRRIGRARDALGAAGALAYSPDQPVPVVGVLFATPLLAAAALWLGSQSFRAALLAIPTELLIGLNACACSACCSWRWPRSAG